MPGCFMKDCEFVINSENTRIKMCCASCVYKVCTNDNNRRKCTLSGKKVTKDFLCRSWRISREMDVLKIGYNK